MGSLALLCMVSGALLASAGLLAAEPPRHVVVIVWDGMRPDFISEQNTPALVGLARQGVTFRNHHSVFLSSTEVNGTAISTGAYPAHDGIIGNNEYRPALEPLKPIHTENLTEVRKGDGLTGGHYLRRPTIAEIVRQAGRQAVVAGAKPVALLADRQPESPSNGGVNIFAGAALPASLLTLLTNRYGAFPAETSLESTRNDWTTLAMIDPLWGRGVPVFSFLWLNEPDFSQHQTGPGSERSLAAMRNADENLARIVRAVESSGAHDTDIIVVSDHGCSTVSAGADLAESLTRSGIKATREFKSKPSQGDILIVSNGGSTFVYVIGHEEGSIRQVVRFLQQWEFTGVIFCRKPAAGTFSLAEACIDSDEAPDIVVSMRWTPDKNKNGTAGMIASDASSYARGQGSHVSLSPFDMHATLVAAGPHFRRGVVSTLASGNVDIAPTVLWILGLKGPRGMDGRVLTEGLTIKGPPVRSFEPRHIEAREDSGGSIWAQYLNITEVNGVRYLDEGNGKTGKTSK